MALTITTTSCVNVAQWRADPNNCIYPAFVDNTNYESWGPGATRADSWRPYFELKATGGSGYTWALTGGALPDGLSLASNGRISGKPVKEGTFTFTVQVSASGDTSDPTSITMIAAPWRGKRLRDARSGITCHITKQSYPAELKNEFIDGVLDLKIDEFEAQFTEFDPEAIAQMTADAGHGFFEISATWQNMFRLWPSTTYTRYQDHATVNYAGNLVDELHARDILAITYFPPDYQALAIPGETGYNRYILTDGDDAGNWGVPNNGLVSEIVNVLKFDAMAIDIGGASSVYPNGSAGIQPGWFYWDNLMPIMRFGNPWFFFGVNPGVRDFGLRKGGTKVQYPDADFVIYETVKNSGTSESLLELAVPYLNNQVNGKKMAIYVWNQISTSFAAGSDIATAPIKTNEAIRSNFIKNINAGASVAHAFPMPSTGEYPHPHFQPTWDYLSDLINEYKVFSNDCKISYASGHVTITTPNRSRIFYTTDGTEPSPASPIYMGPIPVSRNTMVRARALEPGKKIGYIENFQVEEFTIPEMKSLLPAVTGNVSLTDAIGYYRGMSITVLNSPIMLYGIGRQGDATTDHNVMIRKKTNEAPVYSGILKASSPVVNGYTYLYNGGVRLEKGETYFPCIQEGTSETYASNTFGNIPLNPDIRINGYSMMSWLGDMFPTSLDGRGQYIDLKYEVLPFDESKNLLLGAEAVFINNTTGATLGASTTILFATNATNGDSVSFAQAGGQIAYTLRTKMREANEVSQVYVMFGEGIATDFEIRGSMNGSNFTNTTLAHISNNTSSELTIEFTRTTARYIHLRINEPSAFGQAQASIIKLEAYR